MYASCLVNVGTCASLLSLFLFLLFGHGAVIRTNGQCAVWNSHVLDILETDFLSFCL